MKFFYEVSCELCEEPYKMYEGTYHYKLFKEGKSKNFFCEKCTEKVNLAAKRKQY